MPGILADDLRSAWANKSVIYILWRQGTVAITTAANMMRKATATSPETKNAEDDTNGEATPCVLYLISVATRLLFILLKPLASSRRTELFGYHIAHYQPQIDRYRKSLAVKPASMQKSRPHGYRIAHVLQRTALILSPPQGQGADGRARTRARIDSPDHRADSFSLCHRRPNACIRRFGYSGKAASESDSKYEEILFWFLCNGLSTKSRSQAFRTSVRPEHPRWYLIARHRVPAGIRADSLTVGPTKPLHIDEKKGMGLGLPGNLL
ncbi:transmembrane channel-like protein 6 [Plakobranchus ocellatus]|uniref:Transmembrane channel-like protein 6 n=1 Tax=Plakobranchus ocellatus TaxID=259542 RepID=A0AAV4BRU2_9GAST|nr:transmembrane channel-like protein 6 [Plakobranchus ocellatus]